MRISKKLIDEMMAEKYHELPDDVAKVHGITEARRAELDSMLISSNKRLVARLWYDPDAPEGRRCMNENLFSGIIGYGATFEAAIQDMRDKTPNMPFDKPEPPASVWVANFGLE